MTNQDIDIKLLQQDIPALLHKYQYKIAFIVDGFIRQGAFDKNERDDIIQSINEQLFRKKSKIQAQYNGAATISTYLSAIIRNVCLQIYRQNKRLINKELYKKQNSELLLNDGEQNSINHLMIQEELQKLDAIIQMFARQQYKLRLLLKLICRIPIIEVDILHTYPSCPEIYFTKMMQEFGIDYHECTDKEIFERLTYYINILEGKKRTTDAIKKWLSYKLAQIIKILNETSTTANYDRESLKILVTYYYSTDYKVENTLKKYSF